MTGFSWRCAGGGSARRMSQHSALTQASKWRAAATRLAPDEIVEFQSFLQEAHALLGESLPEFPSDVFTH